MDCYICHVAAIDYMKTILVPTDFSDNAWHALKYAVPLFKNIPCYFYILHVNYVNPSGLTANSFTSPSEFQNDSTHKMLSDLLKKIRSLTSRKHHHFIALQENGSLISSIRKTVADKKIDLIVMGANGTSGTQQAVVGSNTGAVITQVPCNLLIIPEKVHLKKPREIAFPTDFNIFYSHNILESISEMLNISKAHLRVINVSKPKGQLNKLQIQQKQYLADYLEELFADSHSFLTKADEKVKNAIEGIAAGGNIDMVLMAAKNLNFLHQLFFDSTIEKLSIHSTIPMLVLHE